MKTQIFFLVMITVLIFNSCQSVNQILTLNDLTEAQKDGDIQIVSVDSTVYYVSKFFFSDSSINVYGTKKKFGILTDYKGELYFKDISYIKTRNTNTIGRLAFVGLTGLIVYSGFSAIENTSGIDANVKIVYPSIGSGTGSCPFIYSWNGNEYMLEGEAFGTALGKVLETETCIVLPELKPSDNKLQIKITNERPETHFFNNIKLVAVETNPEQTVYSDNANSLRSVTIHKIISKAFDTNKSDVTALLTEDDNLYWESDLSSANNNSNFEDKMFVDLDVIDPTDSISLIISAINTDISSKVFSFLQKLLGDEFANFTKAAETDDEIIDVLKKTLIRSALKIDIWDGKDWKYVDLIYPEANQVEFKKLVRVPVLQKGNTMKIRLRCLSDVWKLDAIYYDDSQPKELITHTIDPLYFQSDSQNDLNFIKARDDRYIKLLPNQIMNLEYTVVKTPSNKKITYAITVGGYLYEWIIDNNKIIGDGLKNLNTSTPKMALVKKLLKNIDSILPIIYDDWRNSKLELVSKY